MNIFKSNITIIEIPEGVSKIGNNCFLNCSQITNTIISLLKEIDVWVFLSTRIIILIIIPERLKYSKQKGIALVQFIYFYSIVKKSLNEFWKIILFSNQIIHVINSIGLCVSYGSKIMIFFIGKRQKRKKNWNNWQLFNQQINSVYYYFYCLHYFSLFS